MARYMIMNMTDGITATSDTYKSTKQAQVAIKKLRQKYKMQGYYRTNTWAKIAPEDIQYEVIEVKKGESVLSTAVSRYAEQK